MDNNNKISYSIVSKGKMVINYIDDVTNVSISVSGELIFEPSTFYADLVDFNKAANLSEEIKKEIIDFIERDGPLSIRTKIIFD